MRISRSDLNLAEAIDHGLATLPTETAAEIMDEWDLSYPLSRLIIVRHVTVISDEGRYGLESLLETIVNHTTVTTKETS